MEEKVNLYNELKNGQIKCKNCGATDISLSEKTGLLRCNYCRQELELEKINESIDDLVNLNSREIGAGAQNIVDDINDIITFKCQGCGAEVIIDTNETAQARCHWCRSFLSINEQIPNGSVPDVILPFSVKKEEAETKIREFVNSRKFFAHPKFKKEFTTENIMGVYFPYMLVDVNAHANFIGEGEHLVRRYSSGDNTFYDADAYHVERDFDIVIDDLSIESSKDKLDVTSSNKTNNVINTIMPFDTENCVRWNANYLRGYSSEKRDTNIVDLREIVNVQATDISRFLINNTLKNYDRGVAWKKENLLVKGERWKAAYLPVWLYSYQEIKGNKKIFHYVAVNARTQETMGSVPINSFKLLFVSFLVEILGTIFMFFIEFDYEFLFLFSGIIFYIMMYIRYRNADKRHTYEKDTKTNVSNLKSIDNYIERRKRLRNPRITGVNNNIVKGPKNKKISVQQSINIKIK